MGSRRDISEKKPNAGFRQDCCERVQSSGRRKKGLDVKLTTPKEMTGLR